MSADNWATCPSCWNRAEAEKTAQHEAVVAAYGHVPVEEFDLLRAAATEPIDVRSCQTFREDWEIGLTGTVVDVIYKGRCTVCGSGTEFRDARPIEMKERAEKL